MFFPRFNSSQKERPLSVCTYRMVFLLNPESRPNYQFTGNTGQMTMLNDPKGHI